jgi:hypothetical protein
MQVEADPDTGVSAKTVRELRPRWCSGKFRANRDGDLIATVNEKDWQPLSWPRDHHD